MEKKERKDFAKMKKEFKVTDYGVTPGLERLQTKELQVVFDMCREEGGIVRFPAGVYRTASLRLWSDMTLYLEKGAVLRGSDICEDYEVYPIPEGVALRTDMELIPQYYQNRPWDTYRRAILSAFGEKNISIIGEEGSLIDGDDCADPNGEEGYRGPHGIFLSNVDNITLRGYQINDCGNFMHQIDNCKNIVMQNVNCSGGSDGIHLHHCEDILIEDCIFHTGDDCIAGINMKNLTVRRCELNTSCQVFRAGGIHILVEDCRIWGPGIFPHRITIVQNRFTDLVRKKENTLPLECGRHTMLALFLHFASTTFPNPEPYHDVAFRNCTVENVEKCMDYSADHGPLQSGTHLTDIRFENVTFTGLGGPSTVSASAEEPLTVHLKNVAVSMRDGGEARLFDGEDKNTRIVIE